MVSDPSKIITRIAPSPTGHLHIGRARTALFNYLFTKKNKGELIFRFEDTDKERSKKEFEDIIIQSLKWLGISYDQGPFRQSERGEIYKKYLKQIIESGQAYISDEPDGKNKQVVRLKNPNKKIKFTDLIRGEIEFDTTDLEDFIIARNIEDPVYHLTVVIDDLLMGVTHVIRGEEHVSNTPRQILIQEAIGAPRPIYAHMPLILAPDRSKLSGRHGAVGVTEYRDLGYLPEALVNYLALLGWNPGTDQEIFGMEELVSAFDLRAIQKGGAIFDPVKLKWINKEHMKLLSEEKFKKLLEDFLPENIKVFKNYEEMIPKILPIIRERVSVFSEVREMAEAGELQYFFKMPDYSPENLLCPAKYRKNQKVDLTGLKAVFRHLKSLLEPISGTFEPDEVKNAIWPYAEEQGRGVVLWAIRYALSGKERSPDPFTLASILGKSETIKRLDDALKKVSDIV